MRSRWRHSPKDAWSKIPDLGGIYPQTIGKQSLGRRDGLGLDGGGQIFLSAWVKGSAICW